MNNWYNIDFANLVNWLIPSWLRRQRLYAFAMVMIKGVVFLYQDFLRFRKAKLYQLMITPQVCYLERMLNDRYDFTLRRIIIVDAIDKPPFYIYINPEQKPKYTYTTAENLPKFIYTAGESGQLTDDFIVKVPIDIIFEQAEMRSLVKAYKLAGTRFKIQII